MTLPGSENGKFERLWKETAGAQCEILQKFESRQFRSPRRNFNPTPTAHEASVAFSLPYMSTTGHTLRRAETKFLQIFLLKQSFYKPSYNKNVKNVPRGM